MEDEATRVLEYGPATLEIVFDAGVAFADVAKARIEFNPQTGMIGSVWWESHPEGDNRLGYVNPRRVQAIVWHPLGWGSGGAAMPAGEPVVDTADPNSIPGMIETLFKTNLEKNIRAAQQGRGPNLGSFGQGRKGRRG